MTVGNVSYDVSLAAVSLVRHCQCMQKGAGASGTSWPRQFPVWVLLRVIKIWTDELFSSILLNGSCIVDNCSKSKIDCSKNILCLRGRRPSFNIIILMELSKFSYSLKFRYFVSVERILSSTLFFCFKGVLFALTFTHCFHQEAWK